MNTRCGTEMLTAESRDLPCLRMSSTIRNCLEVLDRWGRGIALVTSEEGVLCGVVTDGDIRRALLAGHALEDSAAGIMNQKFLAVGETVGRAEVMDVMKARGISHIPILDDQGRLCGLHLLRELIGAVMRPNWAVVMAGGRGERLRPLTEGIPKPMIPVAGRPILERLVLHLVGSGVRRIFLSVNYLAGMIESHFGDGSGFGCEIAYLREERPLGTGGALSLLPSSPVHPLLVLNGDLVTNADLGALLGVHERMKNKITIAVHQHPYRVPFGVVDFGSDGLVRGIREKPTERWPVNAGLYVLDPGVLGELSRGKEVNMPDLVNLCLGNDWQVGVHAIEDDWIDVGQRSELERARGQA
jgi:dTDP-glucose pyrophosphorylase/CBS domain-containing protein